MSKGTPPVRILYVITKATWGGAQRYVYDLATHLATNGNDVYVAFGEEGLLADRLRAADIPSIHIDGLARDVSFGAEIRAFRALCTHVRNVAPDVVHTNSSKAGILAALAARICGVRRIVYTAHGWAYNEKRPLWQKILIATAHWLTVLLADTTICVSSAIYRDSNWMPFVRSRRIVIHNGSTPSPLLSRQDARTVLAPSLANHNVWIGTIAELHPTKNLSALIDAFAAIAPPTAALVILGEGQERKHLEKLIASHNLADRVILAGFVPDAAHYLSALDVFVLPSHSEALGYVLLEAGHAGLPVIATRVGGIPDIITDTTGILVKPNDAPSLTSAMETLLEDSALRKHLGDALRAHVDTSFSLEHMVHATRATYF